MHEAAAAASEQLRLRTHPQTPAASLLCLGDEEQQQLGGCKAAPMQRGAPRAPEHAHSAQLQRGILFTRTITEHSQRRLESHGSAHNTRAETHVWRQAI